MKAIVRVHRQLYLAAGGRDKYEPGTFQTAVVNDETGVLKPLKLGAGLLDHVDSTSCEKWWGRINEHGYGCAGRVSAHRAVWEARVSSVPDDLEVAHLCRDRACVSPRHLYLATPWTNQSDRVQDGSVNSGIRNGKSKLTNAAVKEIRELYATGAWAQKELGRKFGVGQASISRIVLGHVYNEAGGPIAHKACPGRQRTVDRDSVRRLIGTLPGLTIAKKLGCSRPMVHLIAADLKLDTRPRCWFSKCYPELEGYTPDQWLRIRSGF